MPKVTFILGKEKKEVEVPEGANLRDVARANGVELYPGLTKYVNCLGHGTCGTCKVLVKSGTENLSPKGKIEKFTLLRMFSTIGHEHEMRLACQCAVKGDCTIETQPSFNWEGELFWQRPFPNK